MKYQALKQLIAHDMNPAKYNPSPAEVEFWLESVPEVNEELFHFMESLVRMSFCQGPAKKRISTIRAEHITLLNAVGRIKNPREDIQILAAALSVSFEGLLERIDTTYKNYADPEQSIPEKLLKTLKAGLEQQIKLLAKGMEQQPVPAALQKPILGCLEDLAKMRSCSYERRNYIIEIIASTSKLLNESAADLYNGLFILLYELNFNTADFIACYREKIKRELALMTDEIQLDMRLERYLWKFKKAPFRKKKIQADFNRRSTADLMYYFIEAEINIRALEARKKEKEKAAAEAEQMAKNLAMANAEAEAEAKAKAEADALDLKSETLPLNYKIQSLLSVDALAYFFRLMAEGQVIEPGVKTELTRFLAKTFVTPGTGVNGISADSFYRKWREPVHTNAMITKAALNRMIKIIDSQF